MIDLKQELLLCKKRDSLSCRKCIEEEEKVAALTRPHCNANFILMALFHPKGEAHISSVFMCQLCIEIHVVHKSLVSWYPISMHI